LKSSAEWGTIEKVFEFNPAASFCGTFFERLTQMKNGIQFTFKESYNISDLLRIMELLRGPGGCPWDAEQDHLSIRRNLIEESYEVVEAIDAASPEMLREELGDLLLQIVFHSRMEEEAGRFTFDDVTDEVCKKLIQRHPHVFGDVNAETSDEVLKNWEQIKNQTKKKKTASQKLQAVPEVFPALLRAQKLLDRTAAAGLKADPESAFELLSAFSSALIADSSEEDATPADLEASAGKLLLYAVMLCRSCGVDAEHALLTECDALVERVTLAEESLPRSQTDFSGLDPESAELILF